ncbi:methyltransferase, FkbM family [Cognatiyoonia koreensis]|uniref:Methyltransferase, FkbM family n=1 Tax=Cognatiyoonia koreensis TaxID=364200 RepID=A0A1I0RKQ8_9RHOB|nr:FkbM family methyltransferase [Cognatiyoonia koreensis]SEW41431.1 methyltransferase, FkbM family [Cognatiyoonia koreensis]
MTPAERVAEARKQLKEAEREVVAALNKNNTRARAPFVRLLHEVRGMLHPAFPYASQAGQDQIVDRYFKGKRGGTFVDVGAYDGLSGSNSLFFERWRNWSGVMVEPVAVQRARAEAQRSVPCLPYAVSDKNGEAQFMAVTEGYTQMSGLLDQYDSKMLERVRADPRHAEQVITVQTRTLAAILEEADLANPDFISLDIEGGELAALEAFPFKNHRVGAWAIENNAGGTDIAKLMRSKGYQLVEFCGPDEVYILSDIM